jgi:anthranilate/para-aminobenzoate synthase component II
MMACEGAKVDLAPEVVHGKIVSLKRPAHTLFSGQDDVMQLARYHSLVVYENTLPQSVKPILVYEKMVMAAESISLPRLGFQFHPESFLTHGGELLIKKTMVYLEAKL